MHHAITRYNHAVTHLDPSGEQGSAGDNRAVANPAIVGHMRILHEEIGVPNDSNFALFAATMDGNAFTKDISVADMHPPSPAGIGDILRLVANHDIRMQDILPS